ncbi:unnamed protein product, partial [Arabidopsis halleri]
CSFLVGDVPRRQRQLIFWVSLWLGSLLHSIVSLVAFLVFASVVAVGGEGVRNGDESFWSLMRRKWFLKRDLRWLLIYVFMRSSPKYFNFS